MKTLWNNCVLLPSGVQLIQSIRFLHPIKIGYLQSSAVPVLPISAKNQEFTVLLWYQCWEDSLVSLTARTPYPVDVHVLWMVQVRASGDVEHKVWASTVETKRRSWHSRDDVMAGGGGGEDYRSSARASLCAWLPLYRAYTITLTPLSSQ